MPAIRRLVLQVILGILRILPTVMSCWLLGLLQCEVGARLLAFLAALPEEEVTAQGSGWERSNMFLGDFAPIACNKLSINRCCRGLGPSPRELCWFLGPQSFNLRRFQ